MVEAVSSQLNGGGDAYVCANEVFLLSLDGGAGDVGAAGIAAAQQPAETAIPDKVRLFIPYKDYTQEDNKRILEMYKWLRVADVSDGMDVVGLQDIGASIPRSTRCGRTPRSSPIAPSASR